MRIGLFAGTTPETNLELKGLVDFARDVESRGFDTLWMPNIFGMDGVGACAIVGWETRRIELGTAVTPTSAARRLKSSRREIPSPLATL